VKLNQANELSIKKRMIFYSTIHHYAVGTYVDNILRYIVYKFIDLYWKHILVNNA